MIAKLELLLDLNNNEYNYNISSILHGIIMEIIPSDYAEFLHNQKILPYSINITNYNNKLLWTINTLNLEAYEIIINSFQNITEIYMKQKRKKIKVSFINLTTTTYEELIQNNYYNNTKIKKEYTIYIQTPLAFKSFNNYIILPNLKLFFQSIMRRFDYFSNTNKIYDSNTLKYLEENIRIRKYKIKSSIMYLHKYKVPGLLGEITININNNSNLIINNLLNLLLSYSEYSGIGIKTALGMGSISLTKPQPPIINED